VELSRHTSAKSALSFYLCLFDVARTCAHGDALGAQLGDHPSPRGARSTDHEHDSVVGAREHGGVGRRGVHETHARPQDDGQQGSTTAQDRRFGVCTCELGGLERGRGRVTPRGDAARGESGAALASRRGEGTRRDLHHRAAGEEGSHGSDANVVLTPHLLHQPTQHRNKSEQFKHQ